MKDVNPIQDNDYFNNIEVVTTVYLKKNKNVDFSEQARERFNEILQEHQAQLKESLELYLKMFFEYLQATGEILTEEIFESMLFDQFQELSKNSSVIDF